MHDVFLYVQNAALWYINGQKQYWFARMLGYVSYHSVGTLVHTMWRRSSRDGACIRVSVWWLGLFVVESVSEDLEAQRIAVAHVLGVVVVRRIVGKNYIFIYICNYDLLFVKLVILQVFM